MHITFVALGFEQLSISQLSAIAKKEGHEVNLAFSASLFNDKYYLHMPRLSHFFDDSKNVIETIKKQKPDVLALSPLTVTYKWMLRIAEEAKMLFPDIKIIFGGAHVSTVPERVILKPYVDYVCVGEGDIAFPEILKAIGNGKTDAPIVNTRFKLPDKKIIRGPRAGFIQDLDSLPFYDKTLWEEYIRIGDLYLTVTSRGCPYRCTFCFNNFLAQLPEGKKGKYVRQRSVEHVIRELKQIKTRYKLRVVGFEDDVFTFNKKWLKEFVYRFKKEIGVPYQCLTHSKYMDEETAQWLSDTGCKYIQLGIQSLDDEYKEKVIQRKEKTEQVERALEVMRKYKLRAKCDHMFGLPGEPEHAQETALKFFIEHPPARIQTYWTSFLPGTEMLNQALEAELINEEDVEKLKNGENLSIFRDCGIKDFKKARRYKAYETVFKLIPLLPRPLRKKLKPAFFERLPLALCSSINFITDLICGLTGRNPVHISYIKHYVYHLYRFFLNKLGIKARPATQPLKNN
jgi:radical SAM superfamily enzyme YgiQ (UPF0313 family)